MGEVAERLRWLAETFAEGNVSRLAKMSGLNKGTLHNYVSGVRSPNIETIVNICKSLGVDYQWLLTGEGKPFPTEGAGEAVNDAATAYAPPPPQPQPHAIDDDVDLALDVLEIIQDNYPDQPLAQARKTMKEIFARFRRGANPPPGGPKEKGDSIRQGGKGNVNTVGNGNVIRKK